MQPLYFSAAAFIIDDIVVTSDNGDKTTYPEVLGGGGIHTIFG
jgi:hypothetical protein